jgi:hypothetical protein
MNKCKLFILTKGKEYNVEIKKGDTVYSLFEKHKLILKKHLKNIGKYPYMNCILDTDEIGRAHV